MRDIFYYFVDPKPKVYGSVVNGAIDTISDETIVIGDLLILCTSQAQGRSLSTLVVVSHAGLSAADSGFSRTPSSLSRIDI